LKQRMPSKGPNLATFSHCDVRKMFNSIGEVRLSCVFARSVKRSRQGCCGSVGVNMTSGWQFAKYDIVSPKPDAISKTMRRQRCLGSRDRITLVASCEISAQCVLLAGLVSVCRACRSQPIKAGGGAYLLCQSSLVWGLGWRPSRLLLRPHPFGRLVELPWSIDNTRKSRPSSEVTQGANCLDLDIYHRAG
jgi:hypothetical protein